MPIVRLLFTVSAAMAVLVPPLLSAKLWYVMAFIFCAPALLKLTVFGIVDVTFKLPAVMVNVLATPKTALADNCRAVPLIITLKRLALPLKVDDEVNVALPAEADRLPFTVRVAETEKSVLVVIEPVTRMELKLLVPAPEIVFDAPVKEILLNVGMAILTFLLSIN